MGGCSFLPICSLICLFEMEAGFSARSFANFFRILASLWGFPFRPGLRRSGATIFATMARLIAASCAACIAAHSINQPDESSTRAGTPSSSAKLFLISRCCNLCFHITRNIGSTPSQVAGFVFRCSRRAACCCQRCSCVASAISFATFDRFFTTAPARSLPPLPRSPASRRTRPMRP